jgi:hypothetical protein
MERVRVLATPAERYVGIGSDPESPVMLLTRSVHTFSMSTPISIIVADLGGRVLRAGVVGPRRVLHLRTKRWVIEAQADAALPSPGSQIVASTMPIRCREH